MGRAVPPVTYGDRPTSLRSQTLSSRMTRTTPFQARLGRGPVPMKARLAPIYDARPTGELCRSHWPQTKAHLRMMQGGPKIKALHWMMHAWSGSDKGPPLDDVFMVGLWQRPFIGWNMDSRPQTKATAGWCSDGRLQTKATAGWCRDGRPQTKALWQNGWPLTKAQDLQMIVKRPMPHLKAQY